MDISPDICRTDHGEVAERPIAGALKAPEGKLSGGSNPSLAACVALGVGVSEGARIYGGVAQIVGSRPCYMEQTR